MLLRARLTALLAVLALAVAGGPGSAAAPTRLLPPAGAIHGRVTIGDPVLPAAPRPGIADLGADLAYRPVDRRRAVVYLDTAPQPAFEPSGGQHATMKQEHETFVPHVLAIRVGTVVDFPNADPFFHNVFSLSRTKSFDLGRYPRGQSRSVRFDQPGIVRVFCDIHSHMSAFILVFAHRFFAVTDEQGRYRIDDVPAGAYTMTAWYEGVDEQSRQVTVPQQGGGVEANFTLRGR